ncbi:MAG: NUDIX hydrolase [Campylobacterota bacterium]|nr:NUDIX hydrolase [Campylobacterota bacterium]
MFTISNFKTAQLDNPHFVKPLRLNYVQNGTHKSWEAVKSFDSVSVLLYHQDRDVFVLVKQFRAAVYMNDSSHTYTYELCAGIIDKDVSLKQIVKEEIDEECGYEVCIDHIHKITSFFTNVGVSGAKQHLFFATVDETMHRHSGGGIETEEIFVEYLHVNDAQKFMYDETKAKTPGLLFAFEWFFKNHIN